MSSRRFPYPLEGVVFVTKKVERIGRRWIRLVAPTEEYAWSREDVEILERYYRCTVASYAGVIPPYCVSLEERVFAEAARRVRERVERWLEALSREYTPTREELLMGVIWRHRSRRLYIIPLYPRRLIGYVGPESRVFETA